MHHKCAVKWRIEWILNRTIEPLANVIHWVFTVCLKIKEKGVIKIIHFFEVGCITLGVHI